jgi:acyl-CoA thioesterase-2
LYHPIVGNLDEDTQLFGSDGIYTATVSPAWEIWGPNGGYMATLALRAGGLEAHIKRPVSFYCQFLRVARFARIEARVSVAQRGRRSEALRISLVQDEKSVLEALLRTALPSEGLEHDAARAPEVEGPEDLPTFEALRRPEWPRFSFWENLETRVIDQTRFAPDFAPAVPRLVEWYRFCPQATFSDPFVDAARALVLIDTLSWPAAWLRHPTTTLRAPSLDVSVFFHRSAQHSEWLLAEQTSPIGREGLIAGAARIFDRDGQLVASGGAQLLCVPGPTG